MIIKVKRHENSMSQLIFDQIKFLKKEERKDHFLVINRDLKLKLLDPFKALYTENMKLSLIKSLL